MQKDLPRQAGKMAVDESRENFRRQGFRNNGITPWPEVERRKKEAHGMASSIREKSALPCGMCEAKRLVRPDVARHRKNLISATQLQGEEFLSVRVPT